MTSPAVLPTRSRLVRLLFRLMPVRLKRALKRKLTPRAVGLLFRWVTEAGPLTRFADAITTFVATVRYPALMRSKNFRLVRSGPTAAVAMVDTALSLRAAQERPLDLVVQTLAQRGVASFHVRAHHPTRTVLGVAHQDADAVIAGLKAAARHTPLYVYDAAGTQQPLPARSAMTWIRLGTPDILGVVLYSADPTGNLLLGADEGCEIEFWRDHGGELTAPRSNRVTDTLPVRGPLVLVAAPTMPDPSGQAQPRQVVTRGEFLGDLIDDITFPIDIVYTWVNGSDPAWRRRRDQALGVTVDPLSAEAANDSRYTSRDELRYSMRSVALYAPWVNHIWLVTDDQVPSWLDLRHKKITVVSHRELFEQRGTLPTFNSQAIETQLHRIFTLTEHFLYFNDDVLLGRPVFPTTFFEPNGLPRIALSTATVKPGPVTLADTPATASGKNNRQLVRSLGRQVTYKIKHVPHPLRRSILTEVVERFSDHTTATAGHQFRHPADVSLTSSLFQYYALATGRAVIGQPSYMYADVAHPTTPRRLRAALAARNYDVMCVNDTNTSPEHAAQVERMVDHFLNSYYPVSAPWELTGSD